MNISGYMVWSHPLQLVSLDSWIGLGKQISSSTLEVERTLMLLWVPMLGAVRVSTAALESLEHSESLVAAWAPIRGPRIAVRPLLDLQPLEWSCKHCCRISSSRQIGNLFDVCFLLFCKNKFTVTLWAQILRLWATEEAAPIGAPRGSVTALFWSHGFALKIQIRIWTPTPTPTLREEKGLENCWRGE